MNDEQENITDAASINSSGESPLNGIDRRTGDDRRESILDRRSGLDRRDCPPELKLPNFERRRGAGIRRPEERRSAEEGELTREQFEFVMAIEKFKKENHKIFPTWTDVLEVIKRLGYIRENMPDQEADASPEA
jgi:hypothetical protein